MRKSVLSHVMSIKVSDVEGWMSGNWQIYFSDSSTRLRLEVNNIGVLRVTKGDESGQRQLLWQGTDISEALLRLAEQA